MQRTFGGGSGPSMTWDNLTADADSLREKLGFERWAVLGHSFGGHVALEYALRYPGRLSHLVLLDTGGDSHWARDNAAKVLATRGHSPKKVELVRRWFNGEFAPEECSRSSCGSGARTSIRRASACTALMSGAAGGQSSGRGPHLRRPRAHPGLDVMDRLGEVRAPTLVIAGRNDFVFPPECQLELVAGNPNARLRIVERAGHNPQLERPDDVMDSVRAFTSGEMGAGGAAVGMNLAQAGR